MFKKHKLKKKITYRFRRGHQDNLHGDHKVAQN